MKKVLLSLMTFVLAMGLFCDQVSAFSEETIDQSYDKIRNHYANNYKELSNVDEIMAVEALGLEVENGGYTYPDLKALDYNDMSVKDISKNLIALVQLGIDPKDVNGVNLIAKIEASIQADGSIIDPKYHTKLTSVYQVWCVYALKVVDSSYLTLAADGLAALQIVNDETIGINNNNGGFDSEWGVSTDITAQCMDALSLVNKDRYQSTLSLTLEYLARKQNDDAGWMSDNVYVKNTNSDTMSLVLNALSSYDKTGLYNGNYNKNGIHPIDTFINFQGSDGRFGNKGNTTDLNDYSTYGAAISLGSQKNGSFILNTNQKYKAIIAGDQNSDNEVVSVPDTSIKGPATSDRSNVEVWLFCMVAAILVLIQYGKLNEQN